MLQRRDERELDRLPGDRDLRRVSLGHDQAVGRRLDPGDLGKRVQVVRDRLARGAQVHRARAALTRAQHVEADVRRDAIQPGAERRPALESVEALPGAQHRLLDRVLRLERRAQHPVAVSGQLSPVLLEPVDQLALREGGGTRSDAHVEIRHVSHRRGTGLPSGFGYPHHGTSALVRANVLAEEPAGGGAARPGAVRYSSTAAPTGVGCGTMRM